jgi:hypothetical protein
MIDIKIHHTEKNQLLSIKGIDLEDDTSKHFFSELLGKLFRRFKYVLVHVSRNNYFDSSIDELVTHEKQLGIKKLAVAPDLFEISFQFDENVEEQKILSILVDLWFAFQHSVYYFLLNKDDLGLYSEKLLKEHFSWKEVTELLDTFVMFRGVEDDVAWIGKSNSLDFEI